MQINSFSKDDLESDIDIIKVPNRRVYFYPVCNGNPMENAFSFTADYIEVKSESILIYLACGDDKYRANSIIAKDKIVGYSF